MPRDLILELLWGCESVSKAELQAALPGDVSDATVKRMLQQLVKEGKLEVLGKGRATRYCLSSRGRVLSTINLDTYFSKEIDERTLISHFNFELFSKLLPGVDLFTPEERGHLQRLQHEFSERFNELSPTERQKEMTRLGVDLSWKSSQIEGNTLAPLLICRVFVLKLSRQGVMVYGIT